MEKSVTTIGEESTVWSEKGAFTDIWHPFVIAVFMLQILIAAAGNSLTAYAYWTSPTLQKDHHNLLICNLSVADFLVALTGVPYSVISFTEAGADYLSYQYPCLTVLLSVGASANMSLAAISILCLERFVAVSCPYRYYTLVTNMSVRLAIAVSYIVAFTPTAFPLLGWSHWEQGMACRAVYTHPRELVALIGTLRAVIIIATVLMNVYIAKVALTKAQASPTNVQHNQESQSNSKPISSYRVTKMLLTVFGVYYACWLPFITLTSLYRSNTSRSTAFLICYDFSKILVGLNSCINPLIYLKSNAEFRKAFLKSLHRICPKQTA